MTAEEYPAVLGLLIRGLATQCGFADNAREILRHVGHPHPEVRAAVAFAVECSTDHEDHEDHKDREALQDVLTLARDPYAEVRRHAVAHLSGLIGRPPAVHAAVHTALRRALYDPDPGVVHDAACALGVLDTGRPLPFRAERILVRRYLDDSCETRYYARAYRVIERFIERWPREYFRDVRDSLPE